MAASAERRGVSYAARCEQRQAVSSQSNRRCTWRSWAASPRTCKDQYESGLGDLVGLVLVIILDVGVDLVLVEIIDVHVLHLRGRALASRLVLLLRRGGELGGGGGRGLARFLRLAHHARLGRDD